MITGSLKNKIDAIRQDFYNENMAQGSDVVNQLTTLMFIKMLDDRQRALEGQAEVAGMPLNQNDLIPYLNHDYKYLLSYLYHLDVCLLNCTFHYHWQAPFLKSDFVLQILIYQIHLLRGRQA